MPVCRVILADDETHVSCIVARKLEEAGMRVCCCRDGEEALEAALSERPDLIITDLQMPHMSGLELADRVKESPATSGVPIIMLTARGYVLDEKRLGELNIVAIVNKPFSARELLRMVQTLLAGGSAGARPGQAEREAA
jgi:two-component system alkaline phosphatase synthesis response regulator PhoP